MAAAPETGDSVGKGDYTKEEIYQWIVDLSDPKKRETALLELRLGCAFSRRTVKVTYCLNSL